MVRPRTADGEDGLQMWRVAVDILNRQLQTADKGWSSRKLNMFWEAWTELIWLRIGTSGRLF